MKERRKTKMSYEQIVVRMLALRKYRKMSQQELAEKSGVGIVTIKNIEAGKHTSTATLDKINKVFDGALY